MAILKKTTLFLFLVVAMFFYSIGLANDMSVSGMNNNAEGISISALIKVTEESDIYTDLNDLSKVTKISVQDADHVFYSKLKHEVENKTYYLISHEPSANKGTLGWVREEDINLKEHYTIDNSNKQYHVIGNAKAYSRAWGGPNDVVYDNLAKHMYSDFSVDLTETVGDEVWYRGVLDGKKVFVHSDFVSKGAANINESKISMAAHLTSEAKIFQNYKDQTIYDDAAPEYDKLMFYVKRAAKINEEYYYLISRQPSDVKGTIGWVHESSIEVKEHYTVNNDSREFLIKGDGTTYNRAWGNTGDIVHDNLTSYKNKVFSVNLTEYVGDQLWYRGRLDGDLVFIKAEQVYKVNEEKTSKIAHLNGNAKIYEDYLKLDNPINAAPEYENAVYYIKKQVNNQGEMYYLLSTKPSDSKGVIGWVLGEDLEFYPHYTTDNNTKTLYLNGEGKAYDKIWGGSKNIVFDSLSDRKYNKFIVNLTETVGDETWYRGKLDGQNVFVHSSQISTGKTNKISELGKISGNSYIFNDIDDTSQVINANPQYTNRVFFIKQELVINGEKLKLISTSPSSTKGVIGYVREKDIETRLHQTVDNEKSVVYLNGTGVIYKKAWGDQKDILISDASDYKNSAFSIDLTETVGEEVWYRGTLNGERAWIQASQFDLLNSYATKYKYSLNDLLDVQLSVNPQTDKYRSHDVWVRNTLIDRNNQIARIIGEITGSSVNIRKEPNTSSAKTLVSRGTTFTYLGNVTGQDVLGSSVWYKIEYKGKIQYVHSKLASASLPYHETNHSTSHRYGYLMFSQAEVLHSTKNWSKINLKPTWRTAKVPDVLKYIDPSKQDDFQFLDLSSSTGVSKSQLNSILEGKGVLHNQGQAYIDANKKYGVNEAYLISHSLLETGNGKSRLASGIEVGLNQDKNLVLVTKDNRSKLIKDSIKVVYNMYGIGAKDIDPIVLGAIYAYEHGWTSVEKAIIEGAAFVSENYFARNQKTLYQMRWNPANPGTYQYATDIGWAAKQVAHIKNIYDVLDNPKITLNIPVYTK